MKNFKNFRNIHKARTMTLDEIQKNLRIKYRVYPISRECEERMNELDVSKSKDREVYAGIEGPVLKLSENKILTFKEEKEDLVQFSEKIMDFSSASTFDPIGSVKETKTIDTPDVLEAEVIYAPEIKQSKISRAKDIKEDSFVYSNGTVIKVKRKKKEIDDLFEFD